jgi:hypothetical protein
MRVPLTAGRVRCAANDDRELELDFITEFSTGEESLKGLSVDIRRGHPVHRGPRRAGIKLLG